MKVSGTDIKFSAFSIEKGDIKYVSFEPALSYDESSNKGTVTIPSIGEYGGTSTFSMEGEGMMVCVTPKLDTVHLAWCGESAEDWWKKRPKRNFVIPEGEGLSKDLGAGREMMNLARTIFNESPEGGAQTKAGVEIDETGKNVFSALSSSYNAFTWCMALGGKNVTAPILAQLYKVNRKLDVINAKLDLVLSYLDQITTQIDFDSFAKAINDRNEKLLKLYNHYSGYADVFQPLFEVPEEQRDNAYYSNVRDQLKWWANNDQAIEDLLNTIDFLPTVKYQNGGKLKSGMSSVYDDLLLATVGFEHEFGIGGETFRLEDISVVLATAQYARLYLEALIQLDQRTETNKSPKILLDNLEEALKKMQENYDEHNVNLDEIRTRRVCYIKGAHFMATDTVLYHVDYSKVKMKYPMPPMTISPIKIQGKLYRPFPTWEFFQFLGSGDPSVLAKQNLAEVEMLEKVRDFYCAPGTPEYDNFFTADNIAEVMMLEYEGTPEGQPAPLLIGCKPSDLLYETYITTNGWPSYIRPHFGLLKVKHNDYLYIDDTAPLVYFKGCGY